jgi:hypothetical protein
MDILGMSSMELDPEVCVRAAHFFDWVLAMPPPPNMGV